MNDTNPRPGTVVKISCDFGYRLDGEETIACGVTGQWSNETTCIYIGIHAIPCSIFTNQLIIKLAT